MVQGSLGLNNDGKRGENRFQRFFQRIFAQQRVGEHLVKFVRVTQARDRRSAR